MANQTISITARPSNAAGHQRHVRRLARAVRHRQEVREVARPRQRIDLPSVGEDDGVEAGDEPGHGDEREHLGEVDSVDGAEAVEQRLARGAEREGAVACRRASVTARDRDRRLKKSTRKPRAISVNMPSMMPFGMSRLRIDRFLRRQRKLLDGEEQPHGERQRGEDAVDAERQEGTVALGQFDRAPVTGRRRC